MPTDVVEEGVTSGASMSADDLKEFKDSLTSSVAAEMRQMREMIAQLLQAQKDGTPPPEGDPKSPNATDAAKAAAEEAAKGARDGLGSEETNDSTKPNENKEYKETPPWFSPNPPIPHPHINHRGDPPKLSDHTFAQWQYLMKSHVQSSSIELWSIIVNGLRVVNEDNMTRREVVDSQLDATAKHMI